MWTTNRLQLPSRRRGGWAILVILVVAVIILLLNLAGPLNKDPQTQVTTAQTSIDRGRVAACAGNRNTINTELTQMMILNNGQMPPVEQLRQRLERYRCPGKGGILVSPQGDVYCTEHAPPPLDQLDAMIPLIKPVVETPIPLPEATPMQ